MTVPLVFGQFLRICSENLRKFSGQSRNSAQFIAGQALIPTRYLAVALTSLHEHQIRDLGLRSAAAMPGLFVAAFAIELKAKP
jgi:hypothetical protein